jgi:hypothetical protein
MKKTCLWLVLVCLAPAIGSAQPIVTKEPPYGTLKRGASVYVDDGSCGKGKIKFVRGGKIGSSIVSRTRNCAPRPAQ